VASDEKNDAANCKRGQLWGRNCMSFGVGGLSPKGKIFNANLLRSRFISDQGNIVFEDILLFSLA